MALQNSEFLVTPRSGSNSKARLVCFPHSGGGPSAFAKWADMLEEHRIEVVVVSLPGRERRIDSPPITDMDTVVSEVAKALQSSGLVDDLPYAFFGHSLGALIAYEVARKLDSDMVSGRPRPLHLFASAHGSPRTAPLPRSKRTGPLSEEDGEEWCDLSKATDEAMIDAVQTFGFLPLDLAMNDGLMKAILPALRSDFEIYETYTPDLERQPLTIPITAMGGKEDLVFPSAVLKTWQKETSLPFEKPDVFDGDHFFIDAQRAAVLRRLVAKIEASLSSLPLALKGSDLKEPPQASRQLMVDVVKENATANGDKDAIVDDNDRLSYQEMLRRVQLIASTLYLDHLNKSLCEVVGLLMAHDSTYMVSMLGIWQAGGAIIVVESHFPAGMCKEICEGAGTRAVVTVPFHASKFENIENCSSLVLDGEWWSSLAKEKPPLPLEDFAKPGIKDLAILMMTSGTTGRPKQIAGSHHFVHLGHLAKNQLAPYQEEDNREAFNVMFVWEALRPLLFGLTAFVLSDNAVLDPHVFVSSLQKHQCTRVLSTPSLLATIMQHCSKDMTKRLERMRTWYMCGEVLPVKNVVAFRELMPHCRLINDYSTWESGDVAYAVVAPSPPYEPSQVFAVAGELAPGVFAAILDPDTKQVLPRGIPGELYIGGPALSSGYYLQEQVTAERFVAGPTSEMTRLWQGIWYKSGDCGRFVGEPPVLEIRGRIDSTVKLRGFKVGIPVVEAAIGEVEGVALCAVVPVYESPAVVDSLLCFVECKDGYGFDRVVTAIRQEAVKTIPRWMLPSYFRPMPSDARSGGESRKLDRKKLNSLADLKSLRENQVELAVETTTVGEGTSVGSQEDGIRGIVKAVWAKALNLNFATLDMEENFFDLGGHSTLAAKIASELSESYGLAVTVLDIYSHSTLGALLAFLEGSSSQSDSLVGRRGLSRGKPEGTDNNIAVVGLAGQFPGAKDAETFWENIRQAAVSATFLSKDLLKSKGVPDKTIAHKDFVPVAYLIEHPDYFDHQFFGINRHEASLMDPQHRLFIECTWHALENAAMPPKSGLSDSVVGVFAASGIDGYLVHHLDGLPLKDTMDPQDIFLAEIGNEKDYIATRVSYLLDFTGPSMNVNSACSSALVACVQASASIAAGQCDAAVAGASSITFPNLGYLYQDGLVSSVDGYVRPFDVGADGTVFGDSVASLVLRRAADAGKNLTYGVLKGFAASNDGGQKAGYAAPSPVGQSYAIMAAMKMMGEDPWSISYVECHATGTRVGDGIEVRGLLTSFQSVGGSKSSGPVALGSVKGNIAHANCAAGATGLVKTLMMLNSKQLAPTANFKTINPKVNLEGTPCFINTELVGWELPQGKPHRAGVSSFGIGGTNAHMIIQGASVMSPSQEETLGASSWPFQLLTVSGRSVKALRKTADKLVEDLEHRAPDTSLAGVAFTLQSARTALPLRKSLVVASSGAADITSMTQVLKDQFPDEEELEDVEEAAKKPTVAFVFPGQGSQYFAMAQGLYESVPLFRSCADKCCELLQLPEHLGFDLRPLLFDRRPETEKERMETFDRPSVTQPALFIVEYCLSKVMLAIGLNPVAVAGHSLGEYTAAVTGGLLELEGAVAIVAARAKATETLAEDGSMLSVVDWTEDELESISKGERPGLWLAAVNSPVHAVISGETDAVTALEAELKANNKKCTKLHVKKAFHSGLIAKAADTLINLGLPAEKAEQSKLTASTPVASNQTGAWLNATMLRDGTYWKDHMRGTVYWRQNASRMLSQWSPSAFLEVGPGNALSALTSKCVTSGEKPLFVQAMRHPKSVGTHDVEALLGAIGRLWEAGHNIDWSALHGEVLGQEDSLPRQLRLSGYGFDETSLWANPERSVYIEKTENPAPAPYAKGGGAAAVPVAKAVAVPTGVLLRFGGQRVSEPTLKAYCLPFASGSATVFAPWAQQVDEVVEVISIELPARGARSEESMPQSDAEDEALLEGLCDAIIADLRGAAFVLVGFSMGGGLCVELALRLVKRKAPLPLALYVAGRKPPAADPSSVGDIDMSNEELAEYAFAPPEVANSPEFLEHVVPLLRSDLGLDARGERRLGNLGLAGQKLPRSIALELYCGTSDTVAPFMEAPNWQKFALSHVGVHYFPGGHEFMQEMRPLILASWRRDAIARLVQLRSAELAVLAAHGAGTVEPSASSRAILSGGSGAEDEKPLPLYAVRWLPLSSSSSSSSSSAAVSTTTPPHVVCIGRSEGDLSAEELEAARTAASNGAALLVVVGTTSGIMEGDAQRQALEVKQAWHFTQLVQSITEAGLSAHIIIAAATAASGAMVLGASKAVAMEASELRIQRIFVALEVLTALAGDDIPKSIEILEIAAKFSRESDIWMQSGPNSRRSKAYSPKLERFAEQKEKLDCIAKLTDDGQPAVYVLTGATGGLGQAVVEWLVHQQGLKPEQLVLLRRSGSSQLSGVLAQCRVVEVSQPDSTEALTNSSLKDVREVTGIFHLAGVLDDGILSGMTEERFAKVAKPKCGILMALMQSAAALNWNLDWILGFSSTSSLFGYAGQINYCAANAMLDNFAMFGASGNLPQGDRPPCRLMVVNWGPWGEAGMAKVGTKAYEQAVAEGDTPLSTAVALRCLAAALRMAGQAQPGAVQLAACDVDWSKSQWRDLPILDLVADRSEAEAPAEAPGAKASSGGGESPEKKVEAFLIQHTKSGATWKRVSGKSLHQLGLDSLEIVQLRNFFNKHFGVNVPLGILADPSQQLSSLAPALAKYLEG